MEAGRRLGRPSVTAQALAGGAGQSLGCLGCPQRQKSDPRGTDFPGGPWTLLRRVGARLLHMLWPWSLPRSLSARQVVLSPLADGLPPLPRAGTSRCVWPGPKFHWEQTTGETSQVTVGSPAPPSGPPQRWAQQGPGLQGTESTARPGPHRPLLRDLWTVQGVWRERLLGGTPRSTSYLITREEDTG